MAHYAFLNSDNIVTEVIPGKDENETIEGLTPEEWYGNYRGQTCIRTSYNSRIRTRYAGIGFLYDPERDVFISPKPFPSWILNEATTEWEAPTPMPVEEGKFFTWNEETLAWVEE